jgi:hypothetical protein
VGNIAQQFLLFLQESLNTVSHAIEVSCELRQFIAPWRNGWQGAYREIAICNSRCHMLEAANGRRDVPSQNQAEQPSEKQSDPSDQTCSQNDALRWNYLGYEDVIAVIRWNDGSASPVRANPKAGVSHRTRFFKDIQSCQGHSAAKDVARFRIQESRADSHRSLDLVEIPRKPRLATVEVKI